MDFVIPVFVAQVHSSLTINLDRQSSSMPRSILSVGCVFLMQPVQFWQTGRRENTLTLCLKISSFKVLMLVTCFIEMELS